MTDTNQFLTYIKQMYRSNNATVRGWARRLEDAYWKEKQLPLFRENQPDGDVTPDNEEGSGET